MATQVQPCLLVRLAACAVLAAVPAVIALGAATNSYADTGDGLVATPTPHELFPGQNNPNTVRVWYQTPNHNNKPASFNPIETFGGVVTPFGQFPWLENLGPIGNLAKQFGLGGLGGFP
jgi:hypothetical protein